MAHIIGSVLFCYGAWLLYSAYSYRKACLLHPAGEDEQSSLAVLGEIMPPLIFLGLGIAAIEVVLAYVMIGPSDMFSLFDLLGVLFGLASYGAFVSIKTKYRLSPSATSS